MAGVRVVCAAWRPLRSGARSMRHVTTVGRELVRILDRQRVEDRLLFVARLGVVRLGDTLADLVTHIVGRL